MLAFDPFALDRSLAGYAARHRRFRRALKQGTARDHVFELLPEELSRDTARELDVLGETDPFAAAAARWMHFLLDEHALIEVRRAVTRAERERAHAIEAPERGMWSIAGMVERALFDAARRKDWLATLAACAPELGARRIELFELSSERGRPSFAGAELTLSAAREFLSLSADAFSELGAGSLAKFVELGLGSDVPGNFPGTLSPRRLSDFFHEGRWLHGLAPELEPLPRVAGASSSLRGLFSFGAALHDAGAKAGPFVLAHEPCGLRRRTFGHLLSLLPFHSSFAERRLDIGRGRVSGYRRALARVFLLGARLHVGRALLASAAPHGGAAYRRCFEEQLPLALGFELPPRLAGALLVDEDGLRSLAALFTAAERDRDLTERHDEDWFRNPRCIEELRADLESPPPLEPAAPVLGAGAKTLASAITEAI